MTIGRTREICRAFLDALNDEVTGELVFVILAEEAKKRGLTLQAEQRGIHGTYVHFVKER